MTSDFVKVGKMPDADNVDMSECQEMRLPPQPKGIRPWTSKDNRYAGEWDDYKKRISHKLYSLWITWASVVMNEGINKQLAEQCEKDTPLFEARCVIIDIMDQIGKNLADTDILEEIAWLTTEDREAFHKAALLKRTQYGMTGESAPPQAAPKT